MSEQYSDEMLDLMRQYSSGRDPRERQVVEFDALYMDYDYEGSVSDFIDKVTLAFLEIPEEHRGTAKVRLTFDDDNSCSDFRIVYEAPEPEEQTKARTEAAANYARRKIEESQKRISGMREWLQQVGVTDVSDENVMKVLRAARTFDGFR